MADDFVEEFDSEDEFEEQLKLQKIEAEKRLVPREEPVEKTRTDEDGTVFEWDAAKRAWFPKLDTEFILKYQLAYGVDTQKTESEKDDKPEKPAESSQQYEFDQALNAYVYLDSQTGVKFKFNNDQQRWEAAVKPSVSIDLDADPPESTTTSSSSSSSTTNNYEWDTERNCYFYTDLSSGVRSYWNEKNQKWEAEELDSHGHAEYGKSKRKAAEGWFEADEAHNKNVYVTGLPADITDEEFVEIMSKYGIIGKDDSNKMKVKVYRDESGVPKGDARCCYLKVESVDLVLRLLDESELRGHKIHVERAQFQMKGTYNPSLKKKKRKQDKKKMEKQRQRLLDWEERPDVVRKKHEKVIVLKNAFKPSDFEKDPVIINQLRDDIREECQKYGDVRKVYVHDRNEDGVATVSFTEVEMADRCVEYLNKRIWKGKLISCEIWDGVSKFIREETDEEKQKRLDEWKNFLETEENS